MENNQSVQEQPTQVRASTLEPGSINLKLKASWKPLLDWVAAHPLLILTGVSAFIIASTAISVISLTYAGRVQREETEQLAVVVEEPFPTTAQTNNAIPVGLLATIALTCAAGSLVIFQRLNRPNQQRKLRQRVKRSAAPVEQRSNPEQKQSSKPRPPAFIPKQAPMPVKTEPVVTFVPPVIQRSKPQQKQSSKPRPPAFIPKQAPMSMVSIPSQPEPVVTIVPPEESHPLDQGEQSLADMMDLRKQRPLYSILRNS